MNQWNRYSEWGRNTRIYVVVCCLGIRVLSGWAQPSIVVQPESRTNFAGETAIFTVVAEGLSPLRYQWRYLTSELATQTNSTLSIPNVQLTQAGPYSVVVTDSSGTVTSRVATLVVRVPNWPVISKSPAGTNAPSGGAGIFRVTATGSAPLRYFWMKYDSLFSNSVFNILTLNNLQISDSGQYWVTVSNAYGTAMSDRAVLEVEDWPPVITQQPSDVTVEFNAPATFGVTAVGSLPISYQWYKDNVPLLGVANRVFTISAVQYLNTGAYSVLVSNRAGKVFSRSASLNLPPPPFVFSLQPRSQTVSEGLGVFLLVNVYDTGGYPIQSYQWFKDGQPVPGATGPILDISKSVVSDSGQYWVRVINVRGAAQSQTAVVTVLPRDRLDDWHVRPWDTTPPFLGLAQGNGIFVGIGNAGAVATSPDGVNWTYRDSGSTYLLRDIAFGAGRFVALGENRALLTSSDGVAWTPSTWEGIPEGLAVVEFVGGRFVAGGSGSTILTSDNGIEWTARTVAGLGRLYDVTYGNGQYIGVGTRASDFQFAVITSNDGVLWNLRMPAVNASIGQMRSVRFGNGVFVGLNSLSRLFSSGDGLTWTYRDQTAQALTFGHGRFVAIGAGPNGIITSEDGAVWRTRAAGPSYVNALIGAENSFLGVGSSVIQSDPVGDLEPRVLRSPGDQTVPVGSLLRLSVDAYGTSPLTYQWWHDGHRLPDRTNNLGMIPASIADSGSYQVIVSNRLGAATSAVAMVTVTEPTPLDRWHWRLPNPEFQSFADITFGHRGFKAVGANGQILGSVDGLEWSPRQSGTSAALSSIASGNGLYVAVGQDSSQSPAVSVALVSIDGVNWTSHQAPAGQPIERVAHGNGIFAAIGNATSPTRAAYDSVISISLDGKEWASRILTTNWYLRSIAFGNGRFVAAGYSYLPNQPNKELLIASENGRDWQMVTSGIPPQFGPLAEIVFGQEFVAVGESGSLASYEGDAWAGGGWTQTFYPEALAFGSGLYVATGIGYSQLGVYGPLARVSRDGLAWMSGSVDLNGAPDAIAYGNGLFVGVHATGWIATSTNGLDWIKRLDPSSSEYNASAIECLGAQCVVVGTTPSDGLNGPAMVVYSTTSGESWTRRLSLPSPWDYFNSDHRLAVGNGRFVGVGGFISFGNAYIQSWTSTNAVNWVVRETGLYGTSAVLAYGNGRFVCCSDSGQCVTSTNGLTWRIPGDPAGQVPVKALVFGGGVFVGLNGNGEVLTSENGEGWQRSGGPGGGLWDLVYGTGRFLGAGAFGSIHHSTDGTHWTFVGNAPAGSSGELSYAGGLYWLDGAWTSTDGAHWEQRRRPDSGMSDVALIGDTVVAVGSGVQQSDPFTSHPPSIVQEPMDRVVLEGLNVSVSVTASGTGPLTYQWWKGDAAIPGATQRLLDLYQVGANDAGVYHVVVSSPLGSVSSRQALLTVEPWQGPIIVKQPQGRSIYTGQSFTLEVTVTGTEPLLYQWARDGFPIPAAWSPRLTIGYAQLSDAGSYSVEILNAAGYALSEAVAVEVLPALPVINQQPYDVYVRAYEAAYFYVSAYAPDNGLLTYQWLKDGQPIEGATTQSIAVNSVQVEEAGRYSVIVSNGSSFVMSQPARLHVEPEGALDHWTEFSATDCGDCSLRDVAYGAGQFVAVGWTYPDLQGVALSSADAQDWNIRWYGMDLALAGVTFGQNQFVAVGNEAILTSPDGMTWTLVATFTNVFLNDVTYGGGQFVAAGYDGNTGSGAFLISPDGMNWTSLPGIIANERLAVTYGQGVYVATGWDSICTSPDGFNWSVYYNGYQLPGVAFGFGTFMAVGSFNNFTSLNGTDWVYQGNGAALWDVTPGQGSFVAVGERGVIQSSPDSMHWFRRSGSLDSTFLWGVAYGNGYFVAVGDGGGVLRSELTPAAPPMIRFESPDQVALEGNWVELNVGVAGTEPFEYQWWKDGAPITGQTQERLSLVHAQLADAGSYVVVVRNAMGATASRAIRLEIEPRVPPLAWHLRNPGPSIDTYHKIVFGNGRFVAMGESMIALTSSDGERWDSIRLPVQLVYAYVTALTYGDGRFATVVDGYPQNGNWEHHLVTSKDGLSWESTGLLPAFVDVLAAGNGLLVAGQGTQVWVSSDGTHWMDRKLSENMVIGSVAYGNGIFVATLYRQDGGRFNWAAATSTNGLDWTIQDHGLSGNVFKLMHVDGLFRGVRYLSGDNTYYLVHSVDGKDWIQSNDSLPPNSYDFAVGDGRIAVVASGQVAGSTDGQTWTYYSEVGYNFNAIAQGAGRWVAVGSQGTIATSLDGQSWGSLSSGPRDWVRAMVFGNGTWVATASGQDEDRYVYAYPGMTNNLMTSPDGNRWTVRATQAGLVLRGLAYGTGLFVGVGERFHLYANAPRAVIATSTDGVSWDYQDLGNHLADHYQRVYAVTYGQGQFVAVGENGLILTSPDGVSWERQHLYDYSPSLMGIAYGQGLYVAAGGFAAWTSPDGIEWSISRPEPAPEGGPFADLAGVRGFFPWPFPTVEMNDIAYGDGRFVMVGGDLRCGRFGCSQSGGTVWSSGDGLTWTREATIAELLYAVTYGHGAFMATGQNGAIYSSTRGHHWTVQIPSASSSYLLNTLAFANGTFLVAGASGRILQSDPLNAAPAAAAVVANAAAIFSEPGMPVVIATNNQTALVHLNGSASSDPDGDPLRHFWFENAATTVPFASGPSVAVDLPVGNHALRLVVSDGLAEAETLVPVRVMSASETVEQIVMWIHNGGLDRRRAHPLLASLKAALASIERGQGQAGANLLHAFQNKVRVQLRKDYPDLSEWLRQAAQAVRDAFGQEGEPEPVRLAVSAPDSEGAMTLRLTGGAGQAILIQRSDDMKTWVDWRQVTNSSGTMTLRDEAANGRPCHFYRAATP